MLRATLRGMRQRKLRLLLAGLSVVLGVSFVAGSMILTDTLGRSFDRIFADGYAHVDVIVRGQPKVEVTDLEGEQVPANIPADTVSTVAAVPGVATATGAVEVDGARVVGADGTVVNTFGPPRLGINWAGEDGLIELREGRGPTAPDEIAIDAALAQAAKLSVGDRVGVLTLAPRQEFTLVGTFGFAGGRDSFGGVQFVAFTDPVAQELMLGEPDVWTQVEVGADPGTDPAHLRDAIAATLGDDYRVHTGEELAAQEADQLKEGLAFVNYVLLGFAGIALFVGVFLILNTFSIVVAQRTRELAIARALGASRRQLQQSVLLEATVIALLASTLGLAAGIGIGALLARLAAGFASLPLASLAVPTTAIVTALTVGLVVTLTAAMLPALRAARVPPVAAMRDAATPDRPLTRITLAGTAVLATGGASLSLGFTSAVDGADLWLILSGVLAVFIAAALLAPLAARPAAAVVGRLFAWSVPGRLGRLNAGRNPRRTAITAAALMVGVALVSGVNVVLQSAKTSLGEAFDSTVQAELIIAGDPVATRPPGFDPAVLASADQLPQVEAIAGLYGDQALVDDQRAWVTAASDLSVLSDIYGATAVTGDLRTLGSDEVAIDTTIADERNLSLGDQVRVQLPRGEPHTLVVAAIYERDTLPGGYMLPESVGADMTVPQPFAGFVTVADGASVADVQSTLSELLADSPEVAVTDRSTYITQQTRQLDTIFVMIQVLLGLAILVAVLGIINTLALSIIERTRELGLLRAVGLGRGATMRMVTVEAVVISLFGAALGVVVGAGLGTAVVRALHDEGITTITMPWADLGMYLLLAAAVGVVAAVIPAIRAARTNVLAAIAYE